MDCWLSLDIYKIVCDN